MSEPTVTVLPAESTLPIVYDVTEEAIAATKEKYAALTADTPEGYQEVALALR